MGDRPADLILVDADVWTGDAARRWARAVAVRGDRIVAVGTDDDVRPFEGPATEVVSLPGRMVTPGFQDAHVHPAIGGAQPPQREPRRRCTPPEAYLARIEALRRGEPRASTGSWAAAGTAPSTPPPAGRVARDLDAVVPDRPVFLHEHGRARARGSTPTRWRWRGSRADTADPWDGYSCGTPTASPPAPCRRAPPTTSRAGVVPQPARGHRMACLRRALSRHLHGAAASPAWQDAWVDPELLERLPRARRCGRAHRPGGDGALVGPASRPRADRRAGRAARARDRRTSTPPR